MKDCEKCQYYHKECNAKFRCQADVDEIKAEVIKEYRDQCQGKCYECDLHFFIDSDGREVKLPYSYSYKTGCDGNRYIDAYQVSILINQAREDAVKEYKRRLTEGIDEAVRCAMCTNNMKTDKGCDGGCVVNDGLYKSVMGNIDIHIRYADLMLSEKIGVRNDIIHED